IRTSENQTTPHPSSADFVNGLVSPLAQAKPRAAMMSSVVSIGVTPTIICYALPTIWALF
ncbi:MAG: hypothetical protein O3C34_18250, partial [Proteobacteria bacterium]|nr:hypothetical protein [Pseudomonadota bacterium]